MPKDIKFNIKLQIDGKEQVVTASTSAKELAKHLNIARQSVDGLSRAFIDFNQAVEVVQNIGEAFSRLSAHMREATQVNALVAQLTGETGDGMLRLRNGVQAVADYFGKDFAEVLRSVNNLSKGFGISAGEALALVRSGLVSGADAGGDFLDTVREYPRYFKEAGLSAEEFIAISTSAAKQGIYSDKGVDAIKEGNIRIREMTDATRKALEGIGISADAVQQGLQEGSLTTFQVMQQVSARLAGLPPAASEVGAALADIFGGPGEDAGLEYIKTLATVETSMEAVKAATEGTAEAQERVISANERMKNGLSSLIDLSGVYSSVQPYIDMAAQLGMATTGIVGLTNVLKGANLQYRLYQLRALAARAATLLFGRGATSSAAASAALGASLTGASAAATLLRGALRAAFIASGVGIAVVALTEGINYLMGRMDEASEKANRLKEAEDGYRTAAASAKAELDKEVASLRSLIASKDDATGAVARLNERYGEAFGTYRTAAEWYDVLTTKGMAYVRMKGYEAQAVKLATQIADREVAADRNRQKRARLISEGRDKEEFYLPANSQGIGGGYYTRVSREMEEAREEANALNDELLELYRQQEAVQKQLAAQSRMLSPSAPSRPEGASKAATPSPARAGRQEGTRVPVEVEPPGPEEAKTYVETLHGMLADAQRRQGDALSVEARLEAQADVERLQRRIDEATRGRLSIEAEVEPEYIVQGSREDLRQSYANAEGRARTIRADYEIGLIGREEAEAELARLNGQVQALGLKPIEIQIDTAPLAQAAEETRSASESIRQGWDALQGVAGGIESVTSALRGDASAWQAVVSVVNGALSLYQGLGSIASLLGLLTSASKGHAAAKAAEAGSETAFAAAATAASATTTALSATQAATARTEAAAWREVAAAKYMAAHAYIPFAGFGIGAGFVASMTALVKAVSVPALAAGGIASGPTLALVGEYAGASAGNPEVIAPLDRLRSLLGPPEGTGGPGHVEFEIKGRTLLGILRKETAVRARGGSPP